MVEEGFFESTLDEEEIIPYTYEEILHGDSINITISPYFTNQTTIYYLKLSPMMRSFNFTLPEDAISARLSALASPMGVGDRPALDYYITSFTDSTYYNLDDFLTSPRTSFISNDTHLAWDVMQESEWGINFGDFISSTGTLQFSITPLPCINDSVAFDLLKLETLIMDDVTYQETLVEYPQHHILGDIHVKSLDNPATWA